ncbi:hypothetical protein A0U94_08025 [Gluconobacter albidus]|uniref:hypothetical protein n=1 Tax=Gluconobacter albidus TaxID=318683 RepID=UPI00098B8414|nr:hypothetical protein [Gluconobacter albidus]AQS90925.1 hypothetical protein A0U94_08025 [Gluconobacter albidus]
MESFEMTTISAANSGLLFGYGAIEKNKSISQTISNGISESTDTISERTQTVCAEDGNQTDSVEISTFTESMSHTSVGYWLPSKNGGLGDFCTAGTKVNGIDAKDIPGAVAGTLSFNMTTGKAVAGTYSASGEGSASLQTFKITDSLGGVSAQFQTVQEKEIDSLFDINGSAKDTKPENAAGGLSLKV